MTVMAAYRLLGWEQPPELVEVPVPRPGPGQLVIRVAGCGLCHSDLAMAQLPASVGEAIGWQMPFTLGHEIAGWVHALGPGVVGLREGEAVALASPSSCGTCRWCRRGLENACPAGLVGRGYGRDGGLAGFVLVEDVRAVLPLGQVDPLSAGPLTDAGATSYHAVRRVLPRLDEDSTVAVFGVGGLGSFVIQLLRALTEAQIVAVDLSAARRQRGVELGAHAALNGVGEGTVDALRGLARPHGVDAVIDLVGTDATIAAGVASLSAGGAFGLVGASGGTLRRPWYGTLPRDGELFTFQGSDLADARAVIDLTAQGAISVDVDLFDLEHVEQAYTALEDGSLRGRAVVQP